MKRPRRRNPVAAALWANAAVLAALLFVFGSKTRGPSLLPAALAEQGPIAGGGGVFIMPAQLQQSAWGCYLLDIDKQTLCTYQFYPGEKHLKLVAARNYKWDRQLNEFNTEPAPHDIERIVELQNNPRGGAELPRN